MAALDQIDLLLELLREAGEEPVSLDELEIVGVRDPASALLALELAGHAVQRVVERPQHGRSVTCVRLAAFGGAPPAATEPAPPAAHAAAATGPSTHAARSPGPSVAGRRSLLAALLFGGLLGSAARDRRR